jgi:uncharacterized integral membrane protein
MRLLLLIPALLYLVLLVINLQIFTATTQINFFWIWNFQIPVVIFISLFFIVYILLIWVGFNLSNYFSKYKNERLEKEVSDLKGKLLDKQGDLLQNIETNMRHILIEFKDESNKKIELYKKETEKVVSNMGYDFSSLKDKVEKIGK